MGAKKHTSVPEEIRQKAALFDAILAGMGELVVARIADSAQIRVKPAAASPAKNNSRADSTPTLLLFSSVRPDGTEPAKSTTTITLPDGGRAVLTVLRSASDKRKTLKSLEKSGAAAVSINAIALLDAKGNLKYANDSFVAMLGYNNVEDVLFRHFSEFCPRAGEADALFKRVKARGKWLGKFNVRRKDKSLLPVQLSANKIGDAGGGFAAIVLASAGASRKAGKETPKAKLANNLLSAAYEMAVAEEHQRQHISALLHDTVCQNLAAAKIKLGSIDKPAASGGPGGALSEIAALIQAAIEDARLLSFELSTSPLLEEAGFEAAVEHLVQRLRRCGFDVELSVEGRGKALDSGACTLLYQAVRELLANVARHSGASKAKVAITSDDAAVRIVVEDDGVGFAAAAALSKSERKSGFGLFNIKERLGIFSGSIDIKSAPGKGARITVALPLTD